MATSAVRDRTEEAPAPQPRGGSARTDFVVALCLGVAGIAAVAFLPPLIVGGVLLTASAVYVFRRGIFNWTSMLFLLTAIIMFVPIRRFALPIPLPFALEPYRVIIAALLIAIAVAAFAKPNFVWRRVLWGWPVAIFLWTLLASIMFNAVALTESELALAGLSNIVQLAFLTSTMLIVRQLLTDEHIVNALVTFIVIGGGIVGFLAFVERVTRVNVFLSLNTFLPLAVIRADDEALRAGGARAYASSQHPIALAVMFCMIIPLAIYLIRFGPWPRHPINRRVVYLAVIAALMVGMLATVSRTGVIVLGVMLLFILIFQPRLGGMILVVCAPLGALLAAVQPKLFGSMVLSLLDVEGTIASQSQNVGYAGQGRIADLGPAFVQVAAQPFYGTGVGSRVVVGPAANADILDNQVLGTLLEAGALGVIGLVTLFAWPVIRMTVFAFRSPAADRHRFLTFLIATSTVGYFTGMFFYDALNFMQPYLLLMILYAIAAWTISESPALATPSRSVQDATEATTHR